MYYRFGDYLLDLEIRKLYLNDTVVSDDGKTIQLLQTLCESYPEVVDKQLLIDTLWPDQVVTDWSLSRLVSDTRQLLGDSGKDQGSIKTVRGRGFRINREVEKLENKDARPAPRLLRKPSKLKQLAMVASLVVVIVSVVMLLKPNNLEATSDLPYRVAVLPLSSNESEPLDEWLRYGIMSMMVEQLGQYKAINTIPVADVITALSGFSDDFTEQNIGVDQFENICGQLGCSHLIVVKYALTENNQQALSYQIINRSITTPIKEFIEPEVLETAGMMLDHLASDLLPIETARRSLKDTFSQDNKANRDYANGVNELRSGDLNAAKVYLGLALKRQPDFFWAKAYLAEIDYRSGNLENVQKTIKELSSAPLEPSQSFFLKHLYSNVLYSLDKLEESMQETKQLLKNDHLKNNFLLQGSELMNIGTSYQALNNPEQAIIYLDQAMDSYEHAKFSPGMGKVHYNIANVYMQTNRLDQALEHYKQSREIYKKCSMTGYALMSKHRIATVSFLLGKPQNAEAELENLVEEYAKFGDQEGVILALMDLAIHSYQTGHFEEAAIRLMPLLEKLDDNEFLFYKNQTLGIATRTYLSLGDIKAAESYFVKINEDEHVDYRAGFILLPSYLMHAKGDFQDAVDTATTVKNKIENHWTEIHESKLIIMKESLSAGVAQTLSY